ncbi:MAG: NADH-quinone oxidoreductase subunit J [Candidatus Binatia bacterium]
MSETLFFVLSGLAVASALGVITRPNPVHSALCLVATLFLLAVFYVALEAHLVAAFQIIVYTGAVMVLFLFVITLLNLHGDAGEARHPVRRLLAYGVAATLAVTVATVLWRAPLEAASGARVGPAFGTTRAVAQMLFTDYLVAFELTSVLLLVAIVGAVVLAQRDTGASQDEEPRW